ncbi:hypothetical protein N0O92_08635 [Alkalihalobacillus sp. MEB130]|uniref:hypothetical protein n=1 Tax=Alkalihalobacillus sp. MEB130 TaxID=2976704 RepID=UPI0028DD54C7|nr:hypothetical protein [Alkalihalobacillus sp. MEB130]MDT8860299.1 hypothetical protein [Alkalihalobacillus sp. MEB130]
MELLVDLWETSWFWKSVIILSTITVIGLLAFLLTLSPYSYVKDLIAMEHKVLLSGKWFIWVRKGKQEELYQRAKRKVSSKYPTAYNWYIVSSIALFLFNFSFGCLVLLGIGGAVDKYVFTPNSPSNEINTKYDDYEDVYYYENDYVEVHYDDHTPGIHHVQPHWVNGYERSDGTMVDGYWRGGEDGYYRSNPDGNPDNNIGSFINSFFD